MEHKCQTWGMKCSDYRCDVCKTTASEHDPAHVHEGKILMRVCVPDVRQLSRSVPVSRKSLNHNNKTAPGSFILLFLSTLTSYLQVVYLKRYT